MINIHDLLFHERISSVFSVSKYYEFTNILLCVFFWVYSN